MGKAGVFMDNYSVPTDTSAPSQPEGCITTWCVQQVWPCILVILWPACSWQSPFSKSHFLMSFQPIFKLLHCKWPFQVPTSGVTG